MLPEEKTEEGSLKETDKDFIEKALKIIYSTFEDRIMATWQVSNALLRMAEMTPNKILKKRLRLIARIMVEKLINDISLIITEERKHENETLIEEGKQIVSSRKATETKKKRQTEKAVDSLNKDLEAKLNKITKSSTKVKRT